MESPIRRSRNHDPRRHGLHRQRPGESKAANIGISLPGTGEAPRCPSTSTAKRRHLEGTYDELAIAFKSLVDNYISPNTPQTRRCDSGMKQLLLKSLVVAVVFGWP